MGNWYVLVEGLYEDHFIPIEKFDYQRYETLLREYKKRAEELRDDPLRIRDFVRCQVYDADTGKAYPAFNAGEPIEGFGLRLDELLLPEVRGQQEGALLGIPRQEDREVLQVQDDSGDN